MEPRRVGTSCPSIARKNYVRPCERAGIANRGPVVHDSRPMHPEDLLPYWGLDGEDVRPAPDNGLINRTYFVGEPVRAVLQWVNPLFHPTLQFDIEAVTRHLEERGLATPRLVPTGEGDLWVEDDQRGVWRVLTYMPGSTIHQVSTPAKAAAAGRLVGAFHAALADFAYFPKAPQRNIHDTPARMCDLRLALERCDGHHFEAPARQLGQEILDGFASWDGEIELPLRICHGDLKISNLRFDEAGEKGICLLDFDTIAPMALQVEMGDAWRSWCNPAGESDPEAVRFDLEIFEASTRAWLAAFPAITRRERASLAGGTERICWELAARFCADAVNNSYFLESRDRWPQPGEHNLVRARGQRNLALAARAAREACEKIFRSA
jgi:Ser/Thr protein kinase RdoA (MazF antagonist)